MTIDKAIEVLTFHSQEPRFKISTEIGDAIKLGIVALKRYKIQCRHPECVITEPLHGETKKVLK